MFCGYTIDNYNGITNSVEKLAIANDPNQQITKQWELISKSNLKNLKKMYNPFSTTLNNEEIIIIGGYHNFTKVYLLNTQTDQCSSLPIENAR